MGNDELAGVTVAVTAERRAADFITVLERHGATVIHTPAIHVLPLSADDDLRGATEAIVAQPPELFVVSTAMGFRGWLEAADEWGLRDELVRTLDGSRVITRGPKAKGAVRGVGLREEWSPETESFEEVLAHLTSEGVAGTRIAVQHHGTITEWEPLTDLAAGLADLGAQVREFSVYRWTRPADQAPMRELVDAIVHRRVDAVTFTSAPAVASLLSTAKDVGRIPQLLEALSGPVAAFCVGSVTASPLEALGVPTLQPARARLGSLAKYVIEVLPVRRVS
ncbi:uroporphyrinogen-III synthase [Rhodococcus triatomae]|uniref:Uroporphyrinogen-III synthase n=1 Tax=Rhodococcus triatomae TaxID=300028 RepID=A0A1G7ZF23_9NOCA|nr:uroporphyrinogen-III synthase [Rhodococcus triatomae]QNG18050.1 uroporphyrinogen-III synthase [Rhodococcus triatomae]QNG22280.1 uroporphyrinogen-III synthase [Rhodococcus triatomae]SDH07373.1 uroporphyrinogen-III synthase [Rhodococcus triatomae]